MFATHISTKKTVFRIYYKTQERVFTIHISGKGPVFRIYYQPSLQVKTKTKNNTTFKMGKGLTQSLHKRS